MRHPVRTTLGVVAALATLAFAGCTGDSESTQSDTTVAAASSTPVAPKRIAYEGQDGSTALELLRDEADVETESSDLGDYVTEIDGRAATKSKYWSFYVDGKLASTGADAYETRDGERIEWRYEG